MQTTSPRPPHWLHRLAVACILACCRPHPTTDKALYDFCYSTAHA